MDVAGVVGLVERVFAVGDDCADREVLRSAVADVRRLQSWCQGRQVFLGRLLEGVSSFPEKDLADGAGTNLREAMKITERAGTASKVPELGAELSTGAVTGEHVDVVGAALRDLSPEQQQRLGERTLELVAWARELPVDEFRNKVRSLVRSLDATAGEARLDRQRKATRLRMWIDHQTGMGRISGEFDPVTYMKIAKRIQDTIDSMFHDATPDTCPTDPIAKQDHLRALALAELVNGGGGKPGRPEAIVVIDTTCPDDNGEPAVDWGLPVEVPHRVLVELFADAAIHPIVIRNGIVVHAPGELRLGRSTPHPNRAQRQRLRGLYSAYAVPGCRVRFDLCDIHHVIWRRHGGLTDLDNLLPVCVRHHHKIHDHGWQLTLTVDRQLTVVLPDGTRMTTGPPKRNAA